MIKCISFFIESILHVDKNPVLRTVHAGKEKLEYAAYSHWEEGIPHTYPEPKAMSSGDPAKTAQRLRQKQQRTPQANKERLSNEIQKTYTAHLRVAYASYVKVPSDY